MNRHLKTAILALCATIFVVANLFAQAGGKQPKAVAVEPIMDAGVVPKGEKISHDFVIRNEGDAPLEITQVKPACGCTVVDFDKTIAPGKTGKVNSVVDTATFSGAIAKGVTVFTNDPATPRLELTVRAKVEPHIAVKPGYARYLTVQGEEKSGTIAQNLWTSDGSPMDVVKVESPYEFLKVSFREATQEERIPEAQGKQWRVEMTLDNNAPVGALAEHVTVHTNHAKQKLVTIPVSGFVRPVITVTPQVADFGTIELKEPLNRALNVRSFSTEPIKVTGVEENVKGIDVKLEPVEDGREYQVRLTLNPEIGKGDFNGKLMIRTDSPKKPLIEVELKGTVI